MLDFLHHLFLPRESNNHKARLLHVQPLFLLILLLIFISILTPSIEYSYPDVLGVTANMSVNELVDLTNQQRSAAGLSPLTLNTQLSQAAAGKANDMLTKNYWSHNAPDGTTPWVFIKGAGYNYIYAGENLARGFTTASEAVNAWMASPGHKSNILSPNYSEIGFAITTGTLTGEETVLIVEMFGNRLESTQGVGSAQVKVAEVTPTSIPLAISLPTVTTIPRPTAITQLQILPSATPTSTPMVLPTVNQKTEPELSQPVQPVYIASVIREPVVDKTVLMKNIAIILVTIFVFLFLVDLIVIEKRKITRLVSHSADHIIFLTMILMAILYLTRGLVL